MAKWLACLLILPYSLVFAPAHADAAKKPVHSRSDLPRFTYPIDRLPSQLLTADDATFAAFAKPVGADAERLLADYDIQDKATLRELLGVKRDLQLLSGEDAAALETTRRIRELEDKPDAKLWSGIDTEAFLKARIATHGAAGAPLQEAFRREFGASVEAMPWKRVANRARRAKTSLRTWTPQLEQGFAKTDLDVAGAKGALGGDAAWALVSSRAALRTLSAYQSQALAVMTAYVAAHNAAGPDIWGAREVTLTGQDRLTPVRLAVWDSGVDPAVYGGHLYTDPDPAARDRHGIAFDLDSHPSHGELLPLTPEQQQAYPGMVDVLKGHADMIANVDSPEADELQRRLTTMQAGDVPAFLEALGLFGMYTHGSHVAGIAIRGNPVAQLVVARLTFDWRNIPAAPTEERVRRWAASYARTAEYFKAHGVRVVNMSWGGDVAGYESDLEKNGLGKDAEDRKQIARKLFDIDRNALEAAIRSAPGILFVCAGGNANSDSGFDEKFPASLKLPNLIAVGAVDQAGDEAPFTSYGDTVVVHANGYEVPSRVPGGREIRMSGTSMASPQVANLAAKLIALDPSLTPEQTIALIRESATASADGRRHLINPKASVQHLRERLGMSDSTAARE